MVLEITTVTGKVSIDSVLYRLPFCDNNGDTHSVKVWKVDKISDGSDIVDISSIKGLFSSQIQEQWDTIKRRPSGPIDILLGGDCLALHPIDLEIKDNMVYSPHLLTLLVYL